MSYLTRIQACNLYDISEFTPFIIEGRRYGWLNRRMRQHLAPYQDVFDFSDDSISLNTELGSYAARTAALEAVNQNLIAQGEFPDWIDERYPVKTSYDAPAVMDMGRAAASSYGVRAFGTHVNGLVGGGSELSVWIARRAENRLHSPGKLDHIAAGGLPMGLSPLENVVKECEEEAGIGDSLARQSQFVREIRYCEATSCGLKQDTIFCYDLMLPETFEPVNRDGEVAGFELWPLVELAERIATTEDFKPNCNLVMIDLLIRKGGIDSTHPDFQEIISALSPVFPE